MPPLTTLCASHRRPTTRTWVKRTRAAPAGGTWQEGLAVAPGHRSGPGARLHGNGLWVGRGLWEALSKPLTLCVFSSPSPLTLGMLHSLGVRAAAIPNPVPQHVKALTRGPATATALQRESPGSRVPGRPRPGCLLCPAPGERGPLFRGPRACQGLSAPSFVLTPRTQWSGPGPGWRAACGTPPHKPGAPTSRTRAASVGGGVGCPSWEEGPWARTGDCGSPDSASSGREATQSFAPLQRRAQKPKGQARGRGRRASAQGGPRWGPRAHCTEPLPYAKLQSPRCRWTEAHGSGTQGLQDCRAPAPSRRTQVRARVTGWEGPRQAQKCQEFRAKPQQSLWAA